MGWEESGLAAPDPGGVILSIVVYVVSTSLTVTINDEIGYDMTCFGSYMLRNNTKLNIGLEQRARNLEGLHHCHLAWFASRKCQSSSIVAGGRR